MSWQQRGTEYWLEGERWPAGRWGAWRPPATDGNLRVSDAERSRVADVLSRHFGDGRLDHAELDDRLNRAMKAKVRSDLSGLLTDLPPIEPEPAPPTPRGRWRAIPVVIALWVLAVAVVASIVTSVHFPFLLLCVAVFLLWRRAFRHGWHHHHHDGSISDVTGRRP